MEAEQIKALTQNLTSLKTELEANKVVQAELLAKLLAQEIQIEQLIGAASQVGMASSFRTAKLEAGGTLRAWLLAFIGTVLGLTLIDFLYIAPAITERDWFEVAVKLPMTFPFVWLGWFFAKQYGYNARLTQDYAFKYASAMAFEAHKREASAADPELLKKLLDTSIRNFADNPLRIFESGHHVSPLQESLDSLLKNTNLLDKLKDAYQKIVTT